MHSGGGGTLKMHKAYNGEGAKINEIERTYFEWHQTQTSLIYPDLMAAMNTIASGFQAITYKKFADVKSSQHNNPHTHKSQKMITHFTQNNSYHCL